MFIREDSAATIRHVLWPHNSEHFGVVGEQYREETVRRMKDDIRLTARLCPQSVLIAEDDNNPHDDKAVAVMYPFEKKTSPTGVPGVVAEVVGYLPREEARRFRTAMKRIDMSGRPLEVCGCVVSMPDRPFDNVKVYLPRNFANLVAKGYAADPANTPAWLMDDSPIEVRPNKDDYGASDVRRLYCRYAQVHAWNSLPYMIEEKAASWEHGIGPVGLAIFLHRTGIDKHTEEGRRQLEVRADQLAEDAFRKTYEQFDDLSQADIRQALTDIYTATGDAGVRSPLTDELVMLEELKAAESKRLRGLVTAWRKIRENATARIKSARSQERFIAFAERKTLFMLQVHLSDIITDSVARAAGKATAAAKRTALKNAIDTALSQSQGLELSGAAQELERLTDFLQAQITRIGEET
jgi:hypothetical protein